MAQKLLSALVQPDMAPPARLTDLLAPEPTEPLPMKTLPMKKISLFLMLAAALTLGVIASAQATPISTTINLGTVYAGNTPDGSGPWLTASFTSTTGSTAGTLTLTSNLSQSDFVQGQNGPNTKTGWSFYLSQTLSDWSCSGACASGVSTNSINKAGPVNGPFDLIFGWTQSNRFVAGSSAVYDLTFANALTGNPFAANDNGWWSVAHVQGIGANASCSGWIVSGDGSGASGSGPCGGGTPPPTNVPEPTNLGMFGIGLLAIGLFLGLRRRVL